MAADECAISSQNPLRPSLQPIPDRDEQTHHWHSKSCRWAHIPTVPDVHESPEQKLD
ncbi:Uncharacterised protein [Vibrio cholerae]|nr:Uncharacterised protein [Vibrio cholerae]